MSYPRFYCAKNFVRTIVVAIILAGFWLQQTAVFSTEMPVEGSSKEEGESDGSYYHTSDGARFPWHRWLPTDKNVRAVMIAVPGMGGAASEFASLGSLLQHQNIAVYAPDLRGQGLDPIIKRRGSELNVDQLLTDIRVVVKESQRRYPNVPVFFWGDSMGALLVIRLLTDKVSPVSAKGIILAVPVVELAHPPSTTVQKIIQWGSIYLPFLRISPEWFKKNPARFTHDPSTQRFLENVPYRIKKFSLSFMEKMKLLMVSANQAAEQMQQPVLVLGAGDDDYIDLQQLRQWFGRIGSIDKTLTIFPNSYHKLLFDNDQKAVEAASLNWLNQRL